MKKVVGLWIDEKKAVVFSLSDEGARIERIPAEVRGNGRLPGGKKAEVVSADKGTRSNDRLPQYFDEVFSHVQDAESILIFGPGGAKLEIQQRLKNADLHGNIVGFETVEKMTDNQIITKIRRRFLT
jgi:hypothetical protein